MEYISSDTNVWIDFMVIDKISLPFLLPYTYVMSEDAVNDELLSPVGFKDELLDNGLVPVEYTEEEFFLADSYGTKYPRLSVYDRLALAIAKSRTMTLLTGDKALRQAAKREEVDLIGTIGILDALRRGKYIDDREYIDCLKRLKDDTSGRVRLPKKILQERIDALLLM